MPSIKTDIRWKQRFQNYQKAFGQLKEALKIQTPDLLQKQGIIQCFEYTFELAWKTLQDFLIQEKGYTERGPRPTLERAFEDGLIAEGMVWMDMLKSRNLTSHLYDEGEVEKIHIKVVCDYFKQFETLHGFFKNQK